MTRQTPETLEARLIAHRKLLALLLSGAQADSPARCYLAERSVAQDGQEDPGAVIDPAFAVAGALADEFRLIGEELNRFSDRQAPAR